MSQDPTQRLSDARLNMLLHMAIRSWRKSAFVDSLSRDEIGMILEIQELRVALASLIDYEPCRMDPLGYCRTHGESLVCPTALARKLLFAANQYEPEGE